MSFKFLTIFAAFWFYTNNADRFCYTEVLKGMQPKCTNIACESSFNSAAEKCHLDENCFGFATTANVDEFTNINHICSCLKKEVDCAAPDLENGAEKLQKGDYNFLMPLPIAYCDAYYDEPCFIQIFDENSFISCDLIDNVIMHDDPVSGKTILDLAKETCWDEDICSSFSIATTNDGSGTVQVYFWSYNCDAIIENHDQDKTFIQYLPCHRIYEFDTESDFFDDLHDDDYEFVVDAAPFDDAESQCQTTFGTNLASVHDEEEWNAVKCLCDVSGENECWLGGKSCLDWTDGTGLDYNPLSSSSSTGTGIGKRSCIENQVFNPFCSESNVFNPICNYNINNINPLPIAICSGPASFPSISSGLGLLPDGYRIVPMPTTVTFKDEGEITINVRNPIFTKTISDKISVYKFAPDPDKRDVNLLFCSSYAHSFSAAGFSILLFDKCGKEYLWEPADFDLARENAADKWCDDWATASNLASNSNAREYLLYFDLISKLNNFKDGEVYIGIYSDIVKDYGFVVYPRQGTMPAPPLISEPPMPAKRNKLNFLPYNYHDQPNTYTYTYSETETYSLLILILICFCFCFGAYYFFKRKRAKLPVYSFQKVAKVAKVGDEMNDIDEEERMIQY